MNIVHPQLLYLLLLLLPLIWLIATVQTRMRKRFHGFAESSFWDFYFGQWSSFFHRLKAVLLTAALGLLIIALARPQWDNETQDIRRSGLDIAICVDVSKSMDATDMTPTRLQRAKDQISAFIDEQRGDRIAIIPFAGTAAVQCPLTDDYEAARLILNSLDSNSIPVWGTDIGKALKVAESVFASTSKTRLIILISDGEDLGEEGIKLAHTLGGKGIIIYTLGVGSPAGTTVRLQTDYSVGSSVQPEITTKLDTKTLEKIAGAANGQFYMVTPAQEEIQAIMKQIALRERNKLSSRRLSLFREQFRPFAVGALLLLLIEALISSKVANPRRKPVTTGATTLLLLCFLLPVLPLSALNLPFGKALQNSRGNLTYRKKDYRKAEAIFGKNALTHPKDPLLQYNHGNAQYRLKNSGGAAQSWQTALAAKDAKLKSDAYYNLGNSQFDKKDYAAALQAYRQAVLANPDNQAARFNYDLAKRLLEQQKQRQQQQNQQNKQDQKKDQNKDRQKQNEQQQDKSAQNEKKEAAERILKALEQKEMNDRKLNNQAPQRLQNNKWW